VELIIGIAGLVVAVVSGVIAWFSLREARLARHDADESAKTAQLTAESASKSASAAESTAKSAEASAAAAASSAESLKRLAGPVHPWKLEHPSDWTWELVNASSRDVDDVRIEVADADAPENIVTAPGIPLQGPNFISQGEPIRLRFEGGAITDPHEVKILVHYRFADEAEQRVWAGFLHR
jgi:cytoskeletal protein RodZ